MSRENPLGGASRIHGELLKLGIDIGETSVGKYMVRRRKPPSQTWRTFLENHAIPPPSGQPSSYARLFFLRRFRDTCCATGAPSSAVSFGST
jgi:hypothetical protein